MAATSRLAAWFPGPASIAALPAPAARGDRRRPGGRGGRDTIGLAYARIVGRRPERGGLYASIVPTLAYALFGPSPRYLVVGPDTATCLLLAAAITQLGVVEPEARAGVAAGLHPAGRTGVHRRGGAAAGVHRQTSLCRGRCWSATLPGSR